MLLSSLALTRARISGSGDDPSHHFPLLYEKRIGADLTTHYMLLEYFLDLLHKDTALE